MINFKTTNNVRTIHFISCIFLLFALSIFYQPDFDFSKNRESYNNFIGNIYVSVLLGGALPFVACWFANYFKKSNKAIFISGVCSQFCLVISMIGPANIFTILFFLMPLLFLVRSFFDKNIYIVKNTKWFFLYFFIFIVSCLLIFYRIFLFY